jgi:CheY-like chemotaxis protein
VVHASTSSARTATYSGEIIFWALPDVSGDFSFLPMQVTRSIGKVLNFIFGAMAFGKFSQMKKASAPFSASECAESKNPLIQVVDDDLRIRQGLQLNLQKMYRVQLCDGGEEGIQAVNDDVDVIILDIKMPGKNGLQVYEAVKAKYPDLPIIFYSAYQSVLEGAELSRKYKPFNYIDKGADVQELLDTIEQAIAYSQALRQLQHTENQHQPQVA